jgi:hypothetical protein
MASSYCAIAQHSRPSPETVKLIFPLPEAFSHPAGKNLRATCAPAAIENVVIGASRPNGSGLLLMVMVRAVVAFVFLTCRITPRVPTGQVCVLPVATAVKVKTVS